MKGGDWKVWVGNLAERCRPQLPACMMLLFLSIFFSLEEGRFFSLQNLVNIMTQTASMSILAIGLTFVLVGGQFDVSGGAVVALVGVVCGRLLLRGLPSGVVVVLGLGLGAAIGWFNGLCVAKLRISSFILTLTTSLMIQGLASAVSGGRTLSGLPESFNFWGGGNLGELPVPVLLTVVLFVLFHLLLSRTIFGHRVYAVGEKAAYAESAGIRTDRIVIANFALAGTLYAVAGIVLTGRLGAAVSTNGIGTEMIALAALAVGGISMTGGRGNLVGTFLGCLIMGVLSNGLNLMNLSPYYTELIRGLVIFGTLILEGIRVIRRRKN